MPRLKKLETQVPEFRETLESLLDFRIAGMPRCAAQARTVVRYNMALERLQLSDGQHEEIRQSILRIEPAFESELAHARCELTAEQQSEIESAKRIIAEIKSRFAGPGLHKAE